MKTGRTARSQWVATTALALLLLLSVGITRADNEPSSDSTRDEVGVDVMQRRLDSYEASLVSTLQDVSILRQRNDELERLVDALNQKALAAQDDAVRTRHASGVFFARHRIAAYQRRLDEALKTVRANEDANEQLRQKLRTTSRQLVQTREAQEEQQERAAALERRSVRREEALVASLTRLRGLLKSQAADWIMLDIRNSPTEEEQLILAGSINNAALYYAEAGRTEEAEGLYAEALTQLERALGPDHETVADCAGGLGGLYYAQRRYREAEAVYRRALTIYEYTLGRDDAKVAVTLNHLACVCGALGNYTEAKWMYERALTILEKGPARAGEHIPAVLNNLALLQMTQKEYVAAEATLKKAVAHVEAIHGQDEPGLVMILQNMAVLYDRTGSVLLAFRCRQRAASLM